MIRCIFTMVFIVSIISLSYAQVDSVAIDKIVQSNVEHRLFEGNVLVADQGRSTYLKSFGYKDSVKTEPVTPNTHFGVASITKMITAIIVLQLVEEGKFKLNDNLSTLLPKIDIPQSHKITVHHLLLHISGLPNEPNEIYFSAKTPKEFVIETLKSNQKQDNFGEFNYANIDYVLLGLIIETSEGKPWQEAVKDRIINRLQLRNTGFLAKENYPDNFAYSYSFNENGERTKDTAFHIENYDAAGCMYSTVQDLLLLDQAMYDDGFLSGESKKLMFTSYPEYNYTGYSVWTYNYPFAETKPRIMERRGGILGSNSVLVRMLDTNQTIIILSNNDSFNPDSFGDKENLREALIIAIGEAGR